jgi:hypothetical protein
MSRRIPLLFAVLLLGGCNVVWTDPSPGMNDRDESVCSGCYHSRCNCLPERKRSDPAGSVGHYRKK